MNNLTDKIQDLPIDPNSPQPPQGQVERVYNTLQALKTIVSDPNKSNQLKNGQYSGLKKSAVITLLFFLLSSSILNKVLLGILPNSIIVKSILIILFFLSVWLVIKFL